MARDRTIRGMIFPGRIAWDGRIARLLADVNAGTATPEVADTVAAIAAGRAFALAPDSTMDAWTAFTLHNLYARVRAGVALRRCRGCGRWFHGFQPRRVFCRPACQKAGHSARSKASRQDEKERQQRALRQVVRSGTR